MAIHRTRKKKESPHYPFVVSWQPNSQIQARVKGESASGQKDPAPKLGYSKSPNLLAKGGPLPKVKKDIVKSLILVSFVLILEVVVYLAMIR